MPARPAESAPHVPARPVRVNGRLVAEAWLVGGLGVVLESLAARAGPRAERAGELVALVTRPALAPLGGGLACGPAGSPPRLLVVRGAAGRSGGSGNCLGVVVVVKLGFESLDAAFEGVELL